MKYPMLCLFLAVCLAQPAHQKTPLWTESEAAAVLSGLRNPDPSEHAEAQKKLRQHGWDLLHLVMQNPRRADWYYNWCTIDEVFQELPCPQKQPRPLAVNRQSRAGESLPDLETVLSSSYYNQPMTDYLRRSLASSNWQAGVDTKLLGDFTLTAHNVPGDAMKAIARMFQAAQGADWQGDVPPPPPDAMIVKPAWYRVPCPSDAVPSIGVWQPAENKPLPAGSWVPKAWPVRVSIRPSTLDYQSLCVVPDALKQQNPPGAQVLNDFFYFRSQLGNTAHFEGPQKPQLHSGDYLLLVGLHVITREQPNWVWTTFWWDPNPGPEETQERPASVAKDQKLRHFRMRISLEPGAEPMFNPYLEGIQPNGTTTHCMACHAKAAVTVPMVNGQPGTLSFSIKERPATHSIGTSFVWSVARRASDYQEK